MRLPEAKLTVKQEIKAIDDYSTYRAVTRFARRRMRSASREP